MFDGAEEAKETDRINSAMPTRHCTELDFRGQSLSFLSRCTIKDVMRLKSSLMSQHLFVVLSSVGKPSYDSAILGFLIVYNWAS